MNKRGFEIAINFLVILIISIVLFGMGVKFTYDIFTGANDLTKMTEDEIDSQIAELQCQNDDRVCFGIEKLEVNRKESGFFGVRVINTLDTSDALEFTINVTPWKFVGADGVSQSFSKADIEYLPESRTVKLKTNEEFPFGIGVEPQDDIPSGSYFFAVEVKCKTSQPDLTTICESYGFSLLRVAVP